MDEIDLFDVDDALEAAVLTQKSLVDTQDRLGVMLDIMPIGLLIHTEQGILFANQAACSLLRTDRVALVGQHLLDFVREGETDAVAAQFRTSFQRADETLRGEAVVGRSDGPQRLVRLITGKLPWEGNAVIQVLLEDITDQRHAENSLRQQAIIDELTGAYNRRHAFYEAALHVEANRLRGVPFSVAMIDIDHFKKINDTRGHAVGDMGLKALTARANRTIPLIRGTDSAMFARLGGEEFVILLPGLGLDDAIIAAEEFRQSVEEMAIPTPTGVLNFTVSVGVASLCGEDADFGAMLTRADEALYEAKGAGRNLVLAAK